MTEIAINLKFYVKPVPTMPLLGFSPKILGFPKQSWVLGIFFEGLGFFLGFSKGPWVFHGFFKICPKIHLFLLFFAESKTFLPKKGQNLRNHGKKFWKSEANKKTFFQEKFGSFQGKCDFPQKFPENVKKFDLGFSWFFLFPNLGFSIFLEWQH